jgi:Ca2+:H+ antiporter
MLQNRCMFAWHTLIPFIAVAVLATAFSASLAMIGAVVAAVHHAEVVAHRVGEPFGTLVLAVAITVIEVALIFSLMMAGGPGKAALPRDTIYAAVMIICNGVVGVCLLVGGLRHREQSSASKAPARAGRAGGAGHPVAGAAHVHHQFARRHLHPAQLVFVGPARWRCGRCSCSCRRCATATTSCRRRRGRRTGARATAGRSRRTWASLGCCWCRWWAWSAWPRCSRRDRGAVAAASAPKAVVGIVIAMLVLLPETWAAVRAARAEPPADQHEPGHRLGAGQHRADDPGGGAGVGGARTAAGAGPGVQGHGAAG